MDSLHRRPHSRRVLATDGLWAVSSKKQQTSAARVSGPARAWRSATIRCWPRSTSRRTRQRGSARFLTRSTGRADRAPWLSPRLPVPGRPGKLSRIDSGEICRDAGLTGLALAERCGWSRSKSSRIMNARTPPSADDIRAWCEACGAEAVAVRMERQRVLYEEDRRFAFLVEESVLRGGIGGAEVMSGQLGHLIWIASLPNVSLGVVPMTPDRERWPAEGSGSTTWHG